MKEGFILKKRADGTYNMSLKRVQFAKGYQVTFMQIGKKYAHWEHRLLTSVCTFLLDSEVYLGVFEGGKPHVSFYTKHKGLAIFVGRLFRQLAVWDWKKMESLWL